MESARMIVQRTAGTAGCRVEPPRGPSRLLLPEDLGMFYSECGGCTLFSRSAYGCRIAGPHELIPSNLAIVGEHPLGDRSDDWYLIARGSSGEAISMDLHPDRIGRCDDSFHDRHGVVGSCPVIAVSFLDLMTRLLNGKGGHWYWLGSDFESIGDAYD